ncbi:RNA-directed DNA polymerase, eukaryota, nucleotide-binding alpha-beta plait domain protein, partial [Tanacetum coccineum]
MVYGDNRFGLHKRRFRSKEDNIQDLSQSVYVTNFPANCGTKELREIGAKHGTLVDVFIANRLSKAGKRFGFLRYIRVKDLDKLVNLLREEWIGNFHLFASKPRFLRKSFVVNGHKNENTAPKKIERKVAMLNSSSHMLEHMGGAKAVFAKVKHLHSIPNLKAICNDQ